MQRENTGRTRRETLKYGSTVAASIGLAGCSNVADQNATPTGSGSFEVCMEPNGCHTLAGVPETYVVYDPAITGMMIALGQGDGVIASQSGRYATGYLEQLPGVTYEESGVGLMDGGAPGKELFYELDADIHLIDHHTAEGYFEFSEQDIEELEEK